MFSRKVKIVFLVVAMFLVAGFLLPKKSLALPDSKLSYQGRLTNKSGNTIDDGTYSIRFSIYTNGSTDQSVWSETQSVSVRNGMFTVMLGSTRAINLEFNNQEYYLGVKVGDDSEMSPRRQIGTAPMAINSKRLNGNEAGTGKNNILQLNSDGEVSVTNAIKTSTYLQAGDGLNVSGGVDFSSATMSSNLNLNSHSILGLANLSASGNLNFTGATMTSGLNMNGNNITGVNNLSLNTSGTLTVDNMATNSGNDFSFESNGSIGFEAASGENIDFQVDGTDIFRVNSSGASVVSGDLSVSGTINDVNFDGVGNIYMGTNTVIGISATEARIEFDTSGAIIVQDSISGVNRLPVDQKMAIYAENSDGLATGLSVVNEYASGVVYGINTGVSGASTTNYGIYSESSNATTNYAGFFRAIDSGVTDNYGIASIAENATNNYAAYFDGPVRGSADWIGKVNSGDWGGATKDVVLSNISATDLVLITPTEQSIGTTYFITINAGVGFTVTSNAGAPPNETMGFSWMVLKQ